MRLSPGHLPAVLRNDLDERVLSYLADALLENTSYYVLQFNSRGVGKSSGWASFTGLTEGKDLEELVQWALGTVPNVKSLVLLVIRIAYVISEAAHEFRDILMDR